ncbi:MAG: GGDEF domain-containing protein [Planctomycetota bacterium]
MANRVAKEAGRATTLRRWRFADTLPSGGYTFLAGVDSQPDTILTCPWHKPHLRKVATMSRRGCLHVTPSVDQLPESPLRQWLDAACADGRLAIVALNDPRCQLLVELLPSDESASRPRLRWTAFCPPSPTSIADVTPPRPCNPPSMDATPMPSKTPRFQWTFPHDAPPETLEFAAQSLLHITSLERELAGTRVALREAQSAIAAARAAASTDFLTGLRTRQDWETRFADELRERPSVQVMATAETDGEPPLPCPSHLTIRPPKFTDQPSRHWAVLVLDLDGLGRINRAGGMETGDQCLRVVGERLREAAGQGQTIARWGGDEFIAAWRSKSRDAAQVEAQRLHAAIADLQLRDLPTTHPCTPPNTHLANPSSKPIDTPSSTPRNVQTGSDASWSTDRIQPNHITSSGGWAWGPVELLGESLPVGGAVAEHPLRHLMRAAERALFRAKDRGGMRLFESR